MEYNCFTNTLAEIPAKIVEIKEVGVQMTVPVPHIALGFELCDGYVVLDDKKDANGFYIGQLWKDGICRPTLVRYEAIYDDDFTIDAFRQIDSHIALFSPDQQTLIAQYALNTKDNLILDLSELLKKPLMLELQKLIQDTIKHLSAIPDESCRQLMADLYWTYRERNLRSIENAIVKQVEMAPED